MTMNTAHLFPNSLLIEAMAATHGVYNKQKTSNDAADDTDRIFWIVSPLPSNIDNVETTLSFAINPAINDVEIRQSPNPNGVNIGDITLASIARILSLESLTILK